MVLRVLLSVTTSCLARGRCPQALGAAGLGCSGAAASPHLRQFLLSLRSPSCADIKSGSGAYNVAVLVSMISFTPVHVW